MAPGASEDPWKLDSCRRSDGDFVDFSGKSSARPVAATLMTASSGEFLGDAIGDLNIA